MAFFWNKRLTVIFRPNIFKINVNRQNKIHKNRFSLFSQSNPLLLMGRILHFPTLSYAFLYPRNPLPIKLSYTFLHFLQIPYLPALPDLLALLTLFNITQFVQTVQPRKNRTSLNSSPLQTPLCAITPTL